MSLKAATPSNVKKLRKPVDIMSAPEIDEVELIGLSKLCPAWI